MTYGRSLTIKCGLNLFVGFWARVARPYGSWNQDMNFFGLLNPRSLVLREFKSAIADFTRYTEISAKCRL